MSDSESGPDLISNLAHEFAERYRRGERPALDEYTQRYPDLATQIRELFPALVVMEQFGSVAGEPTPQAAEGPVPRQLGEYRILREIGRGGMGIVYEAVQESLGRHVALKVLPLHHLLAHSHRERFEREAKAAARLHHTNIVPVFGIGVHEGIHYYAMQYIQGQALDTVLQEVRHLRGGEAGAPRQPLTASIAEGLLTGVATEAPAASAKTDVTNSVSSVASSGQSDLTGSSYTRYFAGVARVGIQVTDALAYAHSMGMVHRDIKPSNLLLDTQATTWITDFGLVKDEGGSDLTTPGDIVGTIRYMAPERLDNQGDGRSDIYGLGATLYEMLTLRPAFPGERRLELIDQVRHVEPRRPRQIDAHIPRDLETVVLKAMAKEPARRYQTAVAMAEDLRRYLADRPVLARRSTGLERAWRWCRRNPVMAVLTASVVTLLLVLLTGAWISNARLQKQLQRVEKAEDEKTDKLWESLLASARASRWSGQPGRRFEGLEAVRQAAAIRFDLRLRNEAIALLTLPDVRIAQELQQGRPTGSAGFTFDSDFQYYARSDLEGNISVRRVADDQEVQLLQGHGTYAYHLEFSPDGRSLIALYRPSSWALWDWRNAQIILEDVTEDFAPQGDFSPDGAILYKLYPRGWLTSYHLPSGQILKRVRISPPLDHARWYAHAIHPDGKLLAIVTYEPAELKIVDIGSGKIIVTRPLELSMGELAWEAGGTRLVLVRDDQMMIWDTRTWTPQGTLYVPDSKSTNAAFSPRDDLLGSSGFEGRLCLWNPTTRRELFGLPGADGVRFNRDGSRLAVTMLGTTLQIWEVAGNQMYRVLRTPREQLYGTWQVHFSHDGKFLATTGGGGARIWDAASGRDIADLPTGICSGVVFAPDDSALFTRTAAGVERWPIRTDMTGLVIGPSEKVADMEWTNLYGTIAAAGPLLAANLRNEGVVLLLDPKDPAKSVKLPGHTSTTNELSVSPDGRWVAATTSWEQPDKLRISDVQTKEMWTYPVKTQAAFSPDGRRVVTGGDSCRIWKTGAWQSGPEKIIQSPPGLGTVLRAAFAPDGNLLAIAYEARAVRLVDVRNDEELATLPAPDLNAATGLYFSPDGSRLAYVIDATGVQLWDLRRLRAELHGLGLDWDLPPYPPEAENQPAQPIRAQVLTADSKTAETAADEKKTEQILHNRLALCEFLVGQTPYHPETFHLRGSIRQVLGQYREAIADFDQALAWQSELGGIYVDRGWCWAALQEWAKADSDFVRAAQLDPQRKLLCDYHRAMVCLARKDMAGYRKLRAGMLAEVGKKLDAKDVFWTAWTAVLMPETPSMNSWTVVFLEYILGRDAKNGDHLNTLGAVLYRAGRFQQAVERLLDAEIALQEMANPSQTVIYTHFFLAMAHHRLGHSEVARHWLKQATDEIDQARPASLLWNRRLSLKLLRAEAEALVQGTSTKD